MFGPVLSFLWYIMHYILLFLFIIPENPSPTHTRNVWYVSLYMSSIDDNTRPGVQTGGQVSFNEAYSFFFRRRIVIVIPWKSAFVWIIFLKNISSGWRFGPKMERNSPQLSCSLSTVTFCLCSCNNYMDFSRCCSNSQCEKRIWWGSERILQAESLFIVSFWGHFLMCQGFGFG